MGKRAIVSVVLLAAGAGIGATTGPALKFPWASEALNAPCGKTALEWKCLEAKIDARPKPLSGKFQIVNFILLPGPTGLQVKADIGIKSGVPPVDPRGANWGRLFTDLTMEVKREAEKTTGPLDENFIGYRVDLFYLGKPASSQDVKGFRLLLKP
jgi:hypothetical protein